MGDAGSEQIEIESGSSEDVDDLRSLWLELHHHHQEVGSASGKFTDDESSWNVRRGSYLEWLADPRSFLLLARMPDGGLAGYAIVRVMESGADQRDAWDVPDTIAEIETMIVSADVRGGGVGTRLMDRIDEELAALGITEVLVGLIPGNDGAQRLYARRGFAPRWLVMARRTYERPGSPGLS